ncbi:hypothetical protein QBC35DRAFT_477173 [Podospora australis]|uniref:F-box domain-containing protein n=1 Tax=Podospora australis TaxID=1536484 RepID=A0AAN7AG11_9PEZI|nr:hypothetical protein QBC35DRAFT_477173 [Podospora australis]
MSVERWEPTGEAVESPAEWPFEIIHHGDPVMLEMWTCVVGFRAARSKTSIKSSHVYQIRNFHSKCARTQTASANVSSVIIITSDAHSGRSNTCNPPPASTANNDVSTRRLIQRHKYRSTFAQSPQNFRVLRYRNTGALARSTFKVRADRGTTNKQSLDMCEVQKTWPLHPAHHLPIPFPFPTLLVVSPWARPILPRHQMSPLDPLYRLVGSYLARGNRSNQQPILCESPLNLPTEIIDLVLERLPPESVIAFSLTCRFFYLKHLPPAETTQKQLSQVPRISLLLLLESQLPDHHFCYDCYRLHRTRLRPNNDVKMFDSYCGNRLRVLGKPKSTWMLDSLPTLAPEGAPTFGDFRLVINRHFYGGEHWLPLSVLQLPATTTTLELPEQPPSLDSAEENGKYYLYYKKPEPLGKIYGFQEFQSPFFHDGQVLDLAVSFKDFVTENDKRFVCRHFPVHFLAEYYRWYSKLLKCQESSAAVGQVDMGSTRILSCDICTMACRLELTLIQEPEEETAAKTSSYQNQNQKNNKKQMAWVLKISQWHNLGSLRTPYDPEWVYNSPFSRLSPPRYTTSPVKEHVYYEWMKGMEKKKKKK